MTSSREHDSMTLAASRSRRLPALGLVALGCFLLHTGSYLIGDSPTEMLWACNIASLLIGLGSVIGWAWPVAAGLSWLLLGTPLWLVYLAGGGELRVTSLGVHLVVPLVGWQALRRLGWPPGTWLLASLMLLVLVLVSRWLGEAATNVNLAFRVWTGWEPLFGVHWRYLLLVGLAHALAFLGIERWVLWRGWFSPSAVGRPQRLVRR